MRIELVRVAGIGPFRDEQRVDFDAFARDGLFLIAGRTGSGKSSILDAIVYALFDQMPRYEAGGDYRPIRSDHAQIGDPSFVEVTFQVASGRYRVWRAPEYERPKARGAGTTTSKPAARLDRCLDGADPADEASWESLEVGQSRVGVALSDLLPLTRSQFMQVVLLAQNRFHEFLVADSSQRTELLRALFATHRFSALAEAIDDRRRTAQRAHELADERVRMLRARLDDLADRGDRVDEALEIDPPARDDDADAAEAIHDLLERLDTRFAALETASSQRSATADTAFDAAEARLREVAALHERQRRRDEARRELATLAARADAIESTREALRRAAAVAPLLPVIGAADEAAHDAAEAHRRALEALADDGAPAAGTPGAPHDPAAPTRIEATIADADARRDAAAAQLGRLESARERELGRPALVSAVDEARDEHVARGEELRRVHDRLRTIPAEREAHDDDRARHALIADGRERAQTDLAAATAARDAAKRAEIAAGELDRVRAEFEAAQTELHERDARHSDLLRTRIEHAAAMLAAKLEPGAACLVCGSCDHPAPATTSQSLDDVGDEAIAEAALVVEQARAQRDDRQRLVAEATERWSAATTAAGGLPVADHERSVADAERRAAAAVEAERQRDGAIERIAALDRERDAGEQRRSALVAEQSTAAANVARHETALAELDAELERARGAFASVSDAITAVERDRDAAGAEAAALRDLVTARRRLDEANRSLDASFREADRAALGLDDRDEAPAATSAGWGEFRDRMRAHGLSSTARDERAATVREYDSASAGVRARLAASELADLPDEPIDLVAATAARTDAVEVRDAARAVHGRAERLREELAELGSAADRDHRELELTAARYERLRGLGSALRGQGSNDLRMSLETYVLAAQMEEIVDAANVRLAGMSSGRYQLQHDDSVAKSNRASGLGLVVLDRYTGRTRPTRSLSGGETFLASLALALGLSDTVTAQAGGIRLDTLFIDEGFGALDAETLEDAMATLDSLRAGGRTVGVISHVEAMHEQIPARLELRVTDRGDSVIDQHRA